MSNFRSEIVLLISAILLFSAVASHAQPKKVGVYYFGSFNSANSPQSFHLPNNTDPWVNLRSRPNPANLSNVPPEDQLLNWPGWPATTWPSNDPPFPERKPAIGWYDNSLTSVVEKHIRQAKASGISYFNFYWYWNSTLNSNSGGETVKEGMTAYLNSSNKDDISFAVSITSHPWSNLNIPLSQFESAAATIATKYASQPNYLRTLSGRPIVFIIDSQGIGNGSNDDIFNFVNRLRANIVATTGLDPFVVFSVELDGSLGFNLKSSAAANGYTCLAHYRLAVPTWQTDYIGTLNKYGSEIVRVLQGYTPTPQQPQVSWSKPMIPCSIVGFNEKPRTGIFAAETSRMIPSTTRYLSDWTKTNLENTLGKLKTYSNELSSTEVNGYINLYAWNEYHENDRNIEPSDIGKDEVLETISTVFDLARSNDQQCRVLGNCIQNSNSPQGTLDIANCSTLAGWARDGDTSSPLRVHLYKNGPYGAGGVFVGEIVASSYRADLPFTDKRHGFSIPTPPAFKTGVATTVFAHAIDINANGVAYLPGGNNALLNLSGQVLTCNP